MKKMFLLPLLAMAIHQTQAQPLPAKDGNYCIDDIYQYIEQKFQASNQIKETKRISASAGATWYYYVKVGFCSGYLVMDMGSKDSSICTNPQYGERIQTIERVYATGDCEQYLPEDDYL